MERMQRTVEQHAQRRLLMRAHMRRRLSNRWSIWSDCLPSRIFKPAGAVRGERKLPSPCATMLMRLITHRSPWLSRRPNPPVQQIHASTIHSAYGWNRTLRMSTFAAMTQMMTPVSLAPSHSGPLQLVDHPEDRYHSCPARMCVCVCVCVCVSVCALTRCDAQWHR